MTVNVWRLSAPCASESWVAQFHPWSLREERDPGGAGQGGAFLEGIFVLEIVRCGIAAGTVSYSHFTSCNFCGAKAPMTFEAMNRNEF